MTGRPRGTTIALWAASLSLTACQRCDGLTADPSPAVEDSPSTPLEAPSTATPPDSIRWIALGGGPAPDANQVSIEQDLGLAQRVLGPGGVTLYAGGPGTRAVQVQSGRTTGDPLRQELADLFAPRAGRSSTYRATTLAVDGPARARTVKDTLRRALAGAGPLLIYVAGHGQSTEDFEGLGPRGNFVDLWSYDRMTVADLAHWLEDGSGDGPPRAPIRLVVTTCFGGGFAELAFGQAQPAAGPPPSLRCGLFATTHDLPASGCDPNPDRAAQEGYGLHFLHALRGEDRYGRPLGAEHIDFDGDGRISLLEAHTRVRIASAGGEVPVTTSERWLREVTADLDPDGPRAAFDLPEERAVITALGEATGLGANLDRVTFEIDVLETRMGDVRLLRDEAAAGEEAAFADVSGEMLSRWPVLDDPWHPEMTRTLEAERAAIEAYLRDAPAYAAWRRYAAQMQRADAELWELRLRAAPLERLERALWTQILAERLAYVGGEDFEVYRSLLGCERTPP